jgi:parallel beta-helix repeat protein
MFKHRLCLGLAISCPLLTLGIGTPAIAEAINFSRVQSAPNNYHKPANPTIARIENSVDLDDRRNVQAAIVVNSSAISEISNLSKLDHLNNLSEPSELSSDRPRLAQFGAAMVFVAPGGNDQTGTGTQAQPLRTITAALQNNLPPGSIIQLAPGTYSAETGEVFPLKLTPGVTLRGDNTNKGEGIVISGGNTFISPTFASQNIAILAAHNSRIEGITVSNSNPRGYGIWVESRRNVGIAYSTFRDTSHDGIFLTGTAHSAIANNVFTQNKGSGISAVGTSTGEVRNNLFDDTGFGLSIGQKSQVFLIENRIVNNVDGVIISNLAIPTLRGNLIANNSRNGLVVLKDRNGQPTPDLGTANHPGGNTFRNNAQKDINNVSGVAVVAAGNEFNQAQVAGELDTVATNIPAAIAQLSPPAPLQDPAAIASPTIPPLPSTTTSSPVIAVDIPELPNVAIAPTNSLANSPTNAATNPTNLTDNLASVNTNGTEDPNAEVTEILIPLPISANSTAAVKLGNSPADRVDNRSDSANNAATSSPDAVEIESATGIDATEAEMQAEIAASPATIAAASSEITASTDSPESTEAAVSTNTSDSEVATVTEAIAAATDETTNSDQSGNQTTPTEPTATALPPLTSITIGRDPSDTDSNSTSTSSSNSNKTLPAQSSNLANQTNQTNQANPPSSSVSQSSPTANPTIAATVPKPNPTNNNVIVTPAPISGNVELVKTALPADVRAQQEGLPPILPGVPTTKPSTNSAPQANPTQPSPSTTATPVTPTRSPTPKPSIIYRVLVVAVSPDTIPKLQQVVPTAFSTQHNGSPAIQVGAYSDRALADEQVSQLSAAGYKLEVVTIRP